MILGPPACKANVVPLHQAKRKLLGKNFLLRFEKSQYSVKSQIFLAEIRCPCGAMDRAFVRDAKGPQLKSRSNLWV